MKLRRLAAYAAAVVVIGVGGLAVHAWLTPTGPEPQSPVAGIPADMPTGMSRGEYLTKAADCVACHTVEGGTPYAGGRPFTLPFGTIYATNITSDEQTGIGKWSDDAFVEAVRAGVGSHGRLYPAMPYTSYAELSREDVLSIKQYLLSLAPVRQSTPENDLSFPFNQRWGMNFWNLAFFRERRFAPQADKDAQWNRGAYLSTALGHCGECHTPRNIGFATKSREYLAGTVVQGWKAYNTTDDDAYGIGAWSDEQLKGFLWRGHAPGRSSASGPMAEVVQYSLQYLSESDMDAMVRYLRDITPSGDGGQGATGPVQLKSQGVAASTPVLPGSAGAGNARGKRLFEGDCAGCHQWDGAGRQTQYASLAGSRAANDPSGMALVQVMLHGTELEVGGQLQSMPAFGGSYSDADIAAVANYVLDHFGDKQGMVSAEQVGEQRKQPKH